MWKQGQISVDILEFRYWIKTTDTISKWGLNGGKITKLLLKCGDAIVANYDGEWILLPNDSAAVQIIQKLITENN